MSDITPSEGSAPKRTLSTPEFVALTACLFATIAFSMDAMLPAMPQISAELTPDDPNRAQLIVTAFVLGMGIGTFFAGPLSDKLGRKPVILGGAALYALAALLAWHAPSLELMLAARVLQGLGGSGTRVVALAMVRDLYNGREMARVMSFIMMIFIIVPAMAPLLGTVIIDNFGWRQIFLAFVLLAIVASSWLGFRQSETLAPTLRRSLKPADLWHSVKETVSHRSVRIVIAVQALIFGMMFSSLVSTQPVFDQTFGRAEEFPFWFAVVALVSGTGNILNATLVTRLGMRFLIRATIGMQVVAASAMVVFTASGGMEYDWYFYCYVGWMMTVFFQLGLTLGNLNAIALEPLGHIAGMASSVTASIATIGAVLISLPVGLSFNGSPLPLLIGVATCAILASYLMWLEGRVRA